MQIKSKSNAFDNMLAIASLATLAMVTTASPVYAQGDEGDNSDESVRYAIDVKGIRRSLEAADEIKRNSNQFLDAIVAKDIGKLPDDNIAEALQRVTGVQIGRTNGEGSFVSLRGLDQTFTQVTVNGQEVQFASSNEGSRNDGVNFRSVSASVASIIEVIKSPTAMLDEGGIGGTVNVIKQRPLDIGERLVSVATDYNYEPNSDDDPTASGSFFASDVFANGTLGASFSVDYRDRNFLRTQDGPNRRDIDGIDTTGDGVENAIHLRRHNPEVQRSDAENISITGTVQWQPSERINLYADLSRFEETFDFQRSILELRFRDEDVDGLRSVVDPATGVVTDLAILSFSDRARQSGQNGRNETATMTWAAGFEYDFSDNFRMLLEYAGSEVSFDSDNFAGANSNFINSGDPTPDDPNDITARLIFDGKTFTLRDVQYDFANVNNFVTPIEQVFIGGSLFNLRRNEASQDNYRAEFEYDLDDAGDASIQFGAKYQSIKQDDATIRLNQCSQSSVDNGICSSVSAGMTTPYQQLNPAFAGSVTQTLSAAGVTYATYDPSAYFSVPGTDGVTYEPARSHGRSDDFRNGNRDVLAAYAMLNFENNFATIPYRGNIGVRYVNTDTTVTSFATDTGDTRRTLLDGGGVPDGFTPVVVNRSYGELLPSFNIAFEVRDDMVVRAAASRVMERPSIRQLAPFVRVNVPITEDENGVDVLDLPAPGDVVTGAGSAGNPDLDPFVANQLDLGYEYYAENSTFSAGFFLKDVENFIADLLEVRTVTAISELDGLTEVTFDAEFETPVNAGGAEIYGFELGYQQDFNFLPAPFDGFGMVANYTRTEVDTDLGVALPGTSENTYNIIGYYEKGPLGIRVAYNHRDGFPIDIVPAGSGVVPESFDDVGLMDFSLSYDFSEKLSFQVSAINLTDEVQEKQLRTLNAGLDDFTFLEEARFTGRVFNIGLSYRF